VAVANALQLEASRRRGSCSQLLFATFYCACAKTAIYQLLVKILTSPLDFLKESNYLAIRRRFHAVTLTLTFNHFALNVCSKQGVTWSNFITNLSEIEQSALNYWWFSKFLPLLRHVVTLTFDPYTERLYVHRVSRV